MAKYVTRDVLDQMCKLYVRPHLDYGDVIYDRDDPEMNQGWIGYAETHVPMFVHKLGLIKPRQT